MAPTLRAGMIVISVPPFRVAAGSVVIFRHKGSEKIKRVKVVEAGRLFVVGDNPAQSTDSRDFGWLEVERVIGRVVWPLFIHKKD